MKVGKLVRIEVFFIIVDGEVIFLIFERVIQFFIFIEFYLLYEIYVYKCNWIFLGLVVLIVGVNVFVIVKDFIDKMVVVK